MSLHVEWSVRAGEQLQEHMEDLEVRASTEVANRVLVRMSCQRLPLGCAGRVLRPQDSRIAFAPSTFPSSAAFRRALVVRAFETIGVSLGCGVRRMLARAQRRLLLMNRPFGPRSLSSRRSRILR